LIDDTREPLRTTVVDINDLGQILGTGVHAVSDLGRDLLWDAISGWQEIPTDQVIWGPPSALNNLTQVVGRGKYSWWLWQPGREQEFWPGCCPNDINDHSQVISSSGVIGSSRAFLWDPAAGQIDLGDPAGLDWSAALGINESGQVVGWWDRSPSVDGEAFTAFIWDTVHGMQDLEVLSNAAGEGWQFHRAEAINDRGQIVGWGINAAGQEHAFLLTPVPEPSAFLLMVAACAAMAFGGRIARRPERNGDRS
jgi:probable HAF family extracellular repeat protein